MFDVNNITLLMVNRFSNQIISEVVEGVGVCQLKRIVKFVILKFSVQVLDKVYYILEICQLLLFKETNNLEK